LEEVETIKRRVTTQTFDELLEQIYTEFPGYTTNSVARMAQ
jgi:hypothetical protein